MNKAYFRAYRERNREQIRKKRREWAANNRDKERAHEAKYRKNNPVKRKARKAVELARRKGLSSPRKCPRCGAPMGRAADGRTLAQAHHTSYSKGTVAFVCPSCHGKTRQT